MQKTNIKFMNIIFIILWSVILLDFLFSASSFSDIPINITFEQISTMLLFRIIIFSFYSLSIFLFRKRLTRRFLIINSILWVLLFIPPFFNTSLYKNYSISSYRYTMNFSFITSFLIFLILMFLHITFRLHKKY